MSDILRVALVAEGPTDFIYLSAILPTLAEGRDVELQLLQPEISEAFRAEPGVHGFGWPGVYRWCLQTATEGSGRVGASALFRFHDVLVVQLDADAAGKTYRSAHIEETVHDLPCERPCPPVTDTTDALRKVMLRWMGESRVPPRTVLCVPSKALETWILVALFPGDRAANSATLECRKAPEALLAGKPKSQRLVHSGKKDVRQYQSRANEFRNTWPSVESRCSQARRFAQDFRRLLNDTG
jgi:hypothetical protein